ncbi:MAG: hypothetical protein PF961_12460 [Planctomycetota bacterium]|jgi:hypothetical protein|nr:hypothetical protein [Planctomycetota bacterium]
MYHCYLIFILAAATLCGVVAVEPMPAQSAARFVDSMGINVIVYDDERHETVTLPRLEELGIRHLRVGLRKAGHDDYRGEGAVILERTRGLGDAGYKLTGIFHCWYTMDEFMDICDALGPALAQAEGPNEPWHKDQKFRWRDQGWPDGPKLFMQDLHAALRERVTGGEVPILSFSGSTSGYGSIEQWIDFGNEHIYPDGGRAITQDDQLAQKIRRCRTTNYPTVPLQFTESGYNSGLGAKPGIRATSEWMQARGVPRLYLEAFRHGLHRLFIYALNARHDTGFSLLNDDGTPRQSFAALRDLVSLLGGAEQEVASPGSLALELACAVPSVHSLLLRRGDGAFVLCVWNDVDGWNETDKTDIRNEEVPATLRFGLAPHSLTQYRPCVDGLTAVATNNAPTTELQLLVPDHPVVVIIEQ